MLPFAGEAIHLARAALTALREHEIEHVGMVPFLLKMQEYGFGSDQLEVMVGGNPDHRIRPGGLKVLGRFLHRRPRLHPI